MTPATRLRSLTAHQDVSHCVPAPHSLEKAPFVLATRGRVCTPPTRRYRAHAAPWLASPARHRPPSRGGFVRGWRRRPASAPASQGAPGAAAARQAQPGRARLVEGMEIGKAKGPGRAHVTPDRACIIFTKRATRVSASSPARIAGLLSACLLAAVLPHTPSRAAQPPELARSPVERVIPPPRRPLAHTRVSRQQA